MKEIHASILDYMKRNAITEECTTAHIASAMSLNVAQVRRACLTLAKQGHLESKKVAGKGSGQFLFWLPKKKPQSLWGWLVNLFK